MALAGDHTETNCQFLYDVENWHERELQQQQPVAPLGAALGRSYDAARVRVSQHDDHARADDGRKPTPVERGFGGMDKWVLCRNHCTMTPPDRVSEL